MTLDEAIEFVKNSDCADSSCGYPLNQKFRTKKEALEDPQVLDDLRVWYSNLGTNQVEAVLWSLSLKDEILKSTKVAAKKTRMFMAAPLFHHVAMVALCGRMHDKLMKDRGTWCSAGRPFQYGGWHAMMSSLSYSWKFGADAEAYDMSINRLLFSAVFELVAYFCPWELKKLEDLFSMALDAICVTCRGDVIWKHTGNPSGWFLTLFVNTIIMYLLLCVTWMTVFDKDEEKSERGAFEHFVHAWLCGDDSLVAVHDSIKKIFTAEEFSAIWSIFGIKTKEIHSGENFEFLEYCGATSVSIFGRWARRPRVQKFLDALCFTLDNDPLYRLQRAISIYHELWPVPEKEIVLGYIDYLCNKHKYLQKKRRRYELSEARLVELHLGLEGASCKQERTKRDTIVFHGKRTQLQKNIVSSLNNMSKKAVTKAVAKDVAKMATHEKAAAVASTIGKTAKKQHKKSGSKWWGLLAGAAKVAADLAPVLGPMLFASHGPTLAKRAAAGDAAAVAVTQSAASGAPVGGVPYASPVGVQPMSGLYAYTAKKGPGGKVIGVVIEGMDYLGDITVSGSAIQGATLKVFDLNPFSSDWNGTRAQREASLYERYRVKRMVGIFQPAVSAQQGGQLMMYIDTDPVDTDYGSGATALQKASAHAGAEVGQVWQMVCAARYSDDKTQDYYADATGSDIRLISPGNLVVMAGSALGAATYGSVYIAYEFEFDLPQIESQLLQAGVYGHFSPNGGITMSLPLGTASYSSIRTEGNLDGGYFQSGPAGAISTLTGFPKGTYQISWRATAGAGLTGVVFFVDGTNYTQTLGTGTILGGTQGNGQMLLTVNSDTAKDPTKGYLALNSTGAAVTTLLLWISSYPKGAALAAKRKKTLQQYEAELDSMQKRMLMLESAVAASQESVDPNPPQSYGRIVAYPKAGWTSTSGGPSGNFSSDNLPRQ